MIRIQNQSSCGIRQIFKAGFSFLEAIKSFIFIYFSEKVLVSLRSNFFVSENIVSKYKYMNGHCVMIGMKIIPNL